MAYASVRTRADLVDLVLAPERYDPRRETMGDTRVGVPLADLVSVSRTIISPGAAGCYLVLDTSDVSEGAIATRKRPIQGAEIGSSKKISAAGCVLISRLRPYLRQVAYVDQGLTSQIGDASIAVSTEFFVLQPRDERSIAFLVPFLLSASVQRVLSAAQEGGHHPRFNESTLVELRVPISLLAERERAARDVQRGIEMFREYQQIIERLSATAEAHVAGTAVAVDGHQGEPRARVASAERA